MWSRMVLDFRLVALTYWKDWLRGMDLNHRPLGYEPNELPDCSTPQLDSNAGCRGRQTCCSLFSRIYRNIGRPNETPTKSTAAAGTQRFGIFRRALSTRIKASAATADTITSIPKNELIRLAKSSRISSVTFRPCSNNQGRNCQYGSTPPRIQSAR